MGLFEQFPYSNFHELNLDWLLDQVKKLGIDLANLKIDVYNDLEVLVQEAIDQGLIDIMYDQGTETINLTDTTGTDTGKLASFFVVGAEKIAVKDTQARSDISTMQTQITNLESAVYPPNPKRMIIVSDSYGLGRNSTVPWTTYFINYMPGYANIYNWSNGSMGIVRQGDGGYRAKEYMQHRAIEVTDPDSVTEVVIAMGANDIADYTNFDMYFADLHSYINTTYPNAKIYVGMIGNVKARSSIAADYLNVVNLYRNAANGYDDVKYLNGVEHIMHNAKLFQADGVHPTTPGSEEIGKGVAAAFRSGAYNYMVYDSISGTNCNVVMAICGDTTYLQFSPNTTNPIVLSGTSFVTYETLNNPLIYNDGGFTIYGTGGGFDPNLDHVGLSIRYRAGVIAVASMKAGATSLASNATRFGYTFTAPTILV